MKDMLSTLLKSGNITLSDVVSVLYENKEEKQMNNLELPKIGYRESRKDYYMTVPVKYSKTGKRYPIYGKTEEEVVKNFKLEISLFNDDVNPDDTEDGIPTLKGMVDFTMKNYIYGKVKETSYLKYENVCKIHIYKNQICHKKINEITSLDLTRFFREEEVATLNVSSLTSIRMILFKSFLRAKERKYVNDNPMEYVEVSYVKCRKNKKKKQTINDSEIDILINHIYYMSKSVSQYRYSPIFLIMLYSGLRIGEAMALRESDIDFENKTLTIDKQIVYIPTRDKNLNKTNMVQRETPPKTESSVRTIKMTTQVELWIRYMIDINKKLEKRDSDHIFINKQGKVPSKSAVNLLWHKILEASEIEYCTPHKLRKTFVTKLLNGGISLPDVAAMAGHKNNSSVTLDTYYMQMTDEKSGKKMADNMENIFDSKDNTVTTINFERYIG